MNIERLPRSNAEAQAKLDRDRQYNLKEGLDARYDFFGGDSKKWEKLNDPEFRSLRRVTPLFDALRRAQLKEDASDSESDDAF